MKKNTSDLFAAAIDNAVLPEDAVLKEAVIDERKRESKPEKTIIKLFDSDITAIKPTKTVLLERFLDEYMAIGEVTDVNIKVIAEKIGITAPNAFRALHNSSRYRLVPKKKGFGSRIERIG